MAIAWLFFQMGKAFSEVEISYEPTDGIVQPIKFGHSNIYFIKTDTGYILIDAGVPGAEEKFDEVLELTDIDPKNIKLIIVTHGHMDHIGLLAYAKEISGGKILAHKSLKDNLAKGEFEEPTARSNMGHFLNIMTMFLNLDIKGFEPDILIDDVYDLSEFGIEGSVIPTPGHSESSITVVLDSGEALIGDMVRPDDSGEIVLGMYYEDKEELLKSLEIVANIDPQTIYLSHGETINNEELKNAIIINK